MGKVSAPKFAGNSENSLPTKWTWQPKPKFAMTRHPATFQTAANTRHTPRQRKPVARSPMPKSAHFWHIDCSARKIVRPSTMTRQTSRLKKRIVPKVYLHSKRTRPKSPTPAKAKTSESGDCETAATTTKAQSAATNSSKTRLRQNIGCA